MMRTKQRIILSIPAVLSVMPKQESVNTILEMAEKKKAGTCKVLIVTGCMAQRYKERNFRGNT